MIHSIVFSPCPKGRNSDGFCNSRSNDDLVYFNRPSNYIFIDCCSTFSRVCSILSNVNNLDRQSTTIVGIVNKAVRSEANTNIFKLKCFCVQNFDEFIVELHVRGPIASLNLINQLVFIENIRLKKRSEIDTVMLGFCDAHLIKYGDKIILPKTLFFAFAFHRSLLQSEIVEYDSCIKGTIISIQYSKQYTVSLVPENSMKKLISIIVPFELYSLLKNHLPLMIAFEGLLVSNQRFVYKDSLSSFSILNETHDFTKAIVPSLDLRNLQYRHFMGVYRTNTFDLPKSFKIYVCEWAITDKFKHLVSKDSKWAMLASMTHESLSKSFFKIEAVPLILEYGKIM